MGREERMKNELKAVRKILAEVKQRITDKDRIDWLASTGHSTFEFMPQMHGGVFVFGAYAVFLGGQEGKGVYFKGLRLAIDAAIDRERRFEKLNAHKPKGMAENTKRTT